MTDDIVTRLRMWGGDPTTWHSDPLQRIEDGVPQDMLHEAAAEIERLRAICNKAQDFINHDKNCAYLMGRTRNCSCGFDKMWNLLNEADRG